jgi:electron transfer flavoprotein alpha subunit
MTKHSIWIVAESSAGVRGLAPAARSLGGDVTALRVEAPGGASVAAGVATVVARVRANPPDIVLVEASPNGRLIAAAVGAALGVSVLTDLSQAAWVDGAVQGSRLIYGGAATLVARSVGPVAVLCVAPGAPEPADPPVAEEVLTVEPDPAIRLVEVRPKPPASTDLQGAAVVVAVGRGLGSAAGLRPVEALAQAVGGVIGCTRPVAEEEKWLPKQAYIGISGHLLKPKLYIGVGVSGQVQHMIGVKQAKVIIAINQDKSAPIFHQCDYGIVGDYATIVPALTARLARSAGEPLDVPRRT